MQRIDWANLHAVEAEADLLQVAGQGHGLLYSNRYNAIVGEWETGKTWLGLLAAAEVVAAGRRALWIDGEDTPATVKTRLDRFGLLAVLDTGRFQWLPADDWRSAEPEDIDRLTEWLHDGFMVIDAANSTGAGESAESYYAWEQRFRVKQIAQGPGGVLVIDHPPKRKHEGERRRGGIGSTS